MAIAIVLEVLVAFLLLQPFAANIVRGVLKVWRRATARRSLTDWQLWEEELVAEAQPSRRRGLGRRRAVRHHEQARRSGQTPRRADARHLPD